MLKTIIYFREHIIKFQNHVILFLLQRLSGSNLLEILISKLTYSFKLISEFFFQIQYGSLSTFGFFQVGSNIVNCHSSTLKLLKILIFFLNFVKSLLYAEKFSYHIPSPTGPFSSSLVVPSICRVLAITMAVLST